MNWIKPFDILPEKEDYAEPCFSLQDMIDAFQNGFYDGLFKNPYYHKVHNPRFEDYFKDKFNIDLKTEDAESR